MKNLHISGSTFIINIRVTGQLKKEHVTTVPFNQTPCHFPKHHLVDREAQCVPVVCLVGVRGLISSSMHSESSVGG